jgi:hypothetical protein
MKNGTKILVALALGVFLCLPGTAWADFTLADVFGGQWQNNPPTPGPIDRIDTFILDGEYVFTGGGTINFSNTGSTTWTGTLMNNTWTEATISPTSSTTPFTGNMNWNYDFAGTYISGTLITLALNYYNGNDFVIAEEWTWGSSGWSGGTVKDPIDPPVPIPASALLLSTGLLGMGLLGWRRKSG